MVSSAQRKRMNTNYRRNLKARRAGTSSSSAPLLAAASMPLGPAIAQSIFTTPTSVMVPRESHLFPDQYNTWAKLVVNSALNGAITTAQSFHVNSPIYNFGPQSNYAGGFATNVPSGIEYLLSSNAAAGSNAPYFLSITSEVIADVEIYNAGTVAAYCTLLPSYAASFSGMTQQNIAEQRGCAQIVVPPTNNTSALRMRAKFSVADILGFPQETVFVDSNYRQNVGALPPYSIYLHFIVASVDGATNANVTVKYTYRLKMRLSGLNSFATGQPA